MSVLEPSPDRATRRSRRVILVAAFLTAAVGLVACEGDPLGADETETGTPGIDREAVLGELEEVRDLFQDGSALDPEMLADVSYEEGELTVTLDDEVTAGDGVQQAEQVCDELAQSIQLPDLSIMVLGPDGTSLASCQFGA